MDSDDDMFRACSQTSQPISLSPASSHELYQPSPQSSLSLGSQSQKPKEGDPRKQRFITERSSLRELFRICREEGCGQKNTWIDEVDEFGAGLRVHTECAVGHKMTWESSEFYNKGRTSRIDVEISTAILLSGIPIESTQSFLSLVNIATNHQTTSSRLYRVVVHPIVWEYWQETKQDVIDTAPKKDVRLTGDGQFDSPGHCAGFCFYSIIDARGLVVDFYVASKDMVSYSSNLECFALKVLLEDLVDKLDITVITTDRSGAIKSLMKDLNEELVAAGFPAICHTFDVWHMVKCIVKDIIAACKLKSCEILRAWIPSLKNMIWWCMRNSGGDANKLREMMLSIPMHMQNLHVFPDNESFVQCSHLALPQTGRDKKWLQPGSLAVKKVDQAIRGRGNRRLKDLDMMTVFAHTGPNETLNSLRLKYAKKAFAFTHEGQLVRSALACIDNNYNAFREQATTADGQLRNKLYCDRMGVNHTAKPVMEDKDETWKYDIMFRVLEAVKTGVDPTTVLPTDDHYKTLSKKRPAPPKEEIVANRLKRSRFK